MAPDEDPLPALPTGPTRTGPEGSLLPKHLLPPHSQRVLPGHPESSATQTGQPPALPDHQTEQSISELVSHVLPLET